MVSEKQKLAAQAIVNIFETGKVIGDYGAVTLLRGDTGHLTYGRSQTTLASGNLFLLIKAYCDEEGAPHASDLSPFLDRLERQDLGLDHDTRFRDLLRDAGQDPVMHGAQDAFFDRVYWAPAIKSCNFIGVTSALGSAVVYDSRIHGSWHRIRDRANDERGDLSALTEQTWIEAYVDVRRAWLAGHSNKLLHKTVYRMDAFKKLIGSASWDLALPFKVRGIVIDEDALTGSPPIRVSAGEPAERLLKLRQPFMRGADVESLQTGLSAAGIDVDTDGIFGPGTERAVIKFQKREGLTVDGVVGPATLAEILG